MTPESTFGPRELLKRRDFRLLWLGQLVSDFGDSLTNLALLIMVNKLTGSTAAMASMAIALALPQVTVGLLAGVYVDRHDRQRIMIVSDLLRAVLVLGFVAVPSAEQVWLLYAIGFIQGAIGSFFNPARSALLPHLVPSKGLLAANSLSQTTRVVAGLLGAATAGVLIGAFDQFWPAFVLDALTFIFSLLLISQIRTTVEVVAVGAATLHAILGQLVDGLQLIFRTRVLIGTLVAAGVTMLGLGAVNILIVPLILNDLQVPATWFGAVQTSETAAMVISGALLTVIASRLRPTAMIVGGLVLAGLGVGFIALVVNVWGLLVVLALIGLAVTPINAGIATLMQTSVPDEVRGRSGATLNSLVQVANLASMALAGLLADGLGVRMVFVLGGALTILAGLGAAWFFRGADQPLAVASAEGAS